MNDLRVFSVLSQEGYLTLKPNFMLRDIQTRLG